MTKNFLCFFLFFFPSLAFSFPDDCSKVMGSKPHFRHSLRQAQEEVIERDQKFKENLPQFKSFSQEYLLSSSWNPKSPPPDLFKFFLPNNVNFISHRLSNSKTPFSVRFLEGGSTLILRAEFQSQGATLATNVALNKMSLMQNIFSEEKWLIPKKSHKALVLFLHGGGTRTAEAAAIHDLVENLKDYGIGVLAMDLFFHGEGPRNFIGTIDQYVQVLMDFAKQFIHPDMPLFVWGHSWGGTLAHRLMQMYGEKKRSFFHKNLLGLIIASPLIDSLPNQSPREKQKAYIDRYTKKIEEKETDLSFHSEANILQDLLGNEKFNPTGEILAHKTFFELNDRIPEHQGADYLKTVMIVGTGDSAVFFNFKDLFKNYYDSLKNVTSIYLDELPFHKSARKTGEEKTGHLLRRYTLTQELIERHTHQTNKDENIKIPQGKSVDIQIGFNFIYEVLKEKTGESIKKTNPLEIENKKDKEKSQESSISNETSIRNETLIMMGEFLNLWANELSFRTWVKNIGRIPKLHNQSEKLYQQLKAKKDAFRDHIISHSLSPKAKLRDLMKSLINEINEENQFSNFLTHREEREKRLAHFRKFFVSFKIINDEFKSLINTETITTTEFKEKAKKILTLLSDSITGKEEKISEKILRNLLKLEKVSPKLILDRFPYVTPKDIPLILEKLSEIKNIQKRISGFYVPNFNDFKNFKENFTDQEIKNTITRIEKIVERRKEITEKIKKISQIKDLKTDFKITERIDFKEQIHAIKALIGQVEDFFLLAEKNPPESLKSSKDFIQTFETLKNIFLHLSNVVVQEVAVEMLEKKLPTLVENEVSKADQILKPHIEKLEEDFFQLSKDYSQIKKKFRTELINAITTGNLQEISILNTKTKKITTVFTKGIKAILRDLYKEGGLYSEANQISYQIAEIEEKIWQLKKEDAELIAQYNELIPFDEPSIKVEWIDAWSLIHHLKNFPQFESVHQDEKILIEVKEKIETIKQEYKKLTSRVLPKLP